MEKNKVVVDFYIDLQRSLWKKIDSFPTIVVGGSYGLELTFPEYPQNAESDIDLFINIPYKYKDQIITVLIEKYPQCIVSEIPYSHIKGQFLRVIIFDHQGYKFDLIFYTGTIENLIKNTCSSISKLYYTLIGYEFCLVQRKDIQSSVIAIKSKKCFVDLDKATMAHLIKIEKKCADFGLTLITEPHDMIMDEIGIHNKNNWYNDNEKIVFKKVYASPDYYSSKLEKPYIDKNVI